MNFTPGSTYEISSDGPGYPYRFVTVQWDLLDLVLIFEAVGDGTRLNVSSADMQAMLYEIKELVAV